MTRTQVPVGTPRLWGSAFTLADAACAGVAVGPGRGFRSSSFTSSWDVGLVPHALVPARATCVVAVSKVYNLFWFFGDFLLCTSACNVSCGVSVPLVGRFSLDLAHKELPIS